jgi:hypothetical protein
MHCDFPSLDCFRLLGSVTSIGVYLSTNCAVLRIRSKSVGCYKHQDRVRHQMDLHDHKAIQKIHSKNRFFRIWRQKLTSLQLCKEGSHVIFPYEQVLTYLIVQRPVCRVWLYTSASCCIESLLFVVPNSVYNATIFLTKFTLYSLKFLLKWH